jgi:uncharacterized protein (TIGR03067 family)
MSKRGLACFVVAMLIGADEPKKDESAKDVERFQGTWTLLSLENNGESATSEALKGRRLIVTGNESVFMEGERVFSRSTQKLDATKNPRQVDITQVEGDEKGKVTKGIYLLDGDDLTICYVYPGDGRPSEFKAGKDTGCILLKFRRAKR